MDRWVGRKGEIGLLSHYSVCRVALAAQQRSRSQFLPSPWSRTSNLRPVYHDLNRLSGFCVAPRVSCFIFIDRGAVRDIQRSFNFYLNLNTSKTRSLDKGIKRDSKSVARRRSTYIHHGRLSFTDCDWLWPPQSPSCCYHIDLLRLHPFYCGSWIPCHLTKT
jgi:hypothetical protein